jgi:DNA-binding MarR family transcriptional regulator
MSAVTPVSALVPSLLDGLAVQLPAPRGCTHFQLRQLARQVGLVYDTALAAVGLKTTQYSLLSAVQTLGPVRPGDLARAMKMEPSTLTRNLKPLLVAGWVVLAAGSDGRSRAVSITPAGRALREQARQRWRLAQDQLNHTLGEARVAALHALIQESLILLAEAGAETADD